MFLGVKYKNLNILCKKENISKDTYRKYLIQFVSNSKYNNKYWWYRYYNFTLKEKYYKLLNKSYFDMKYKFEKWTKKEKEFLNFFIK